MKFYEHFKSSLLGRMLVAALVFSLALGPSAAHAQIQPLPMVSLPVPGSMVFRSAAFVPVLLKGMTLHPEDPLKFDFIIDSGNTKADAKELKEESERLVKYFLASMTIPKDELWVNLSPEENDRIIPEELAKTELGRDMLAQDYLLKQLSASLLYPEKELGEKFWKKIYAEAKRRFGTSEIPVNTFNKVWIVPEKAVVYEHENTVYIVESKLKVMLDSDYTMWQKNKDNAAYSLDKTSEDTESTQAELSAQIVREVVIPEIEKEVNEGKNFAPLRQIYHSLILAKWYKETVRETLLSKVYVDQKKVGGIEVEDAAFKEQIYERYMAAYKQGVFNYIKEDYDQLSEEVIPRKYLSGGITDSNIAIERSSSSSAVGNSVVGTTSQLSLRLEAMGQDGSSASSPISSFEDRLKAEEDKEQPTWVPLSTDHYFLLIGVLEDDRRDPKLRITAAKILGNSIETVPAGFHLVIDRVVQRGSSSSELIAAANDALTKVQQRMKGGTSASSPIFKTAKEKFVSDFGDLLLTTRHKNHEYRDETLGKMIRENAPQVFNTLQIFLYDEGDALLRSEAVAVLGKYFLDSPELEQVMLDKLNKGDNSTEVMERAVTLLGVLESKASIEAMLSLERMQPHPKVSLAIYTALGEIGVDDPRVISLLERIAGGVREESVRIAALMSLNQLSPDAAKNAAKTILKYQKSERPKMINLAEAIQAGRKVLTASSPVGNVLVNEPIVNKKSLQQQLAFLRKATYVDLRLGGFTPPQARMINKIKRDDLKDLSTFEERLREANPGLIEANQEKLMENLENSTLMLLDSKRMEKVLHFIRNNFDDAKKGNVSFKENILSWFQAANPHAPQKRFTSDALIMASIDKSSDMVIVFTELDRVWSPKYAVEFIRYLYNNANQLGLDQNGFVSSPVKDDRAQIDMLLRRITNPDRAKREEAVARLWYTRSLVQHEEYVLTKLDELIAPSSDVNIRLSIALFFVEDELLMVKNKKERLLRLLKDSDLRVRLYATAALRLFNDAETKSLLEKNPINFLEIDNEEIRHLVAILLKRGSFASAAKMILDEIDDSRAVDFLVEEYHREKNDSFKRIQIVEALALLKHPRVEAALQELLESDKSLIGDSDVLRRISDHLETIARQKWRAGLSQVNNTENEQVAFIRKATYIDGLLSGFSVYQAKTIVSVQSSDVQDLADFERKVSTHNPTLLKSALKKNRLFISDKSQMSRAFEFFKTRLEAVGQGNQVDASHIVQWFQEANASSSKQPLFPRKILREMVDRLNTGELNNLGDLVYINGLGFESTVNFIRYLYDHVDELSQKQGGDGSISASSPVSQDAWRAANDQAINRFLESLAGSDRLLKDQIGEEQLRKHARGELDLLTVEKQHRQVFDAFWLKVKYQLRVSLKDLSSKLAEHIFDLRFFNALLTESGQSLSGVDLNSFLSDRQVLSDRWQLIDEIHITTENKMKLTGSAENNIAYQISIYEGQINGIWRKIDELAQSMSPGVQYLLASKLNGLAKILNEINYLDGQEKDELNQLIRESDIYAIYRRVLDKNGKGKSFPDEFIQARNTIDSLEINLQRILSGHLRNISGSAKLTQYMVDSGLESEGEEDLTLDPAGYLLQPKSLEKRLAPAYGLHQLIQKIKAEQSSASSPVTDQEAAGISPVHDFDIEMADNIFQGVLRNTSVLPYEIQQQLAGVLEKESWHSEIQRLRDLNAQWTKDIEVDDKSDAAFQRREELFNLQERITGKAADLTVSFQKILQKYLFKINKGLKSSQFAVKYLPRAESEIYVNGKGEVIDLLGHDFPNVDVGDLASPYALIGLIKGIRPYPKSDLEQQTAASSPVEFETLKAMGALVVMDANPSQTVQGWVYSYLPTINDLAVYAQTHKIIVYLGAVGAVYLAQLILIRSNLKENMAIANAGSDMSISTAIQLAKSLKTFSGYPQWFLGMDDKLTEELIETLTRLLRRYDVLDPVKMRIISELFGFLDNQRKALFKNEVRADRAMIEGDNAKYIQMRERIVNLSNKVFVAMLPFSINDSSRHLQLLIHDFIEFPTEAKEKALTPHRHYAQEKGQSVDALLSAYQTLKEYQPYFLGNAYRLDRSEEFSAILKTAYELNFKGKDFTVDFFEEEIKSDAQRKRHVVRQAEITLFNSDGSVAASTDWGIAKKSVKGAASSSSPVVSVVSDQGSVLMITDKRAPSTDAPGGIDMNEIPVERQGEGITTPFDSTPTHELFDMPITGFRPVIINIQPLPSLLPLLGLDENRSEAVPALSAL